MIQNPKDIRLRRLCLTNGPIHWPFGRCLRTDIYSRYLRLQGRDVLFAEAMNMVLPFSMPKKGITPQEVIDKYDGIIVNHLLTLISPLIIILELPLKFTMIQLQSFYYFI
jgi:hypothetical protein